MYGQNISEREISIKIEQKSLIQILYELSTTYKLDFYFDPTALPGYKLEGDYNNKPIYHILQELTNGTNLTTVPHGQYGIALIEKDKLNRDYLNSLIELWNNGTYTYPVNEEAEVITINLGHSENKSTNATIILNIYDSNSNLPLIGATVTNADLSIAELSNTNGKCKINCDSGPQILKINYTGYREIILNAQVFSDAEIDVPLKQQSFFLDEINIVANKSENKLAEVEAGKEVISLEKIEAIPQLLGEADLIKSLELLPGVTSATELSQGFNVRGGSTDQNLILLNDGIIFNPTHIVGFISAINSDLLTDAALYKGYVDPASGGRIASVLDMKAEAKKKSGQKYTFKGGLGISLMKFSCKGSPNHKFNFLVGGRGSFNDYLLSKIANVELQKSNAKFYDFNSSLAYDLTDKHKIILNTYNSTDAFEYNDAFGFAWSNTHQGVILKSNWGQDTYSKISVNHGSYRSENYTEGSSDAFIFESGLQYLRTLFSISRKIFNQDLIKLGLEYSKIHKIRDSLEANGHDAFAPSEQIRRGSATYAPYFSYELNPSDHISIKLGSRYSIYHSTGPGFVYNYENEVTARDQIISNDNISGIDKQGAYSIIEPRATLLLRLGESTSLNSTYNRLSQNVFQLTTSNSALPSDIWTTVNRHIKPSIVDQYSLGIVQSFSEISFQLSTDVFFKDMSQLYELKDFSDIILNPHIETELLESKGKSYGMELLLNKTKGKWQGSLAYTYSRTFRQTRSAIGSINKGLNFPSNFDIPHQINVLASYKWLPFATINFAYVFRSGRPTTAPTETFIQEGFVVPIYSDRNQERVPYYSRLDVSFNIDMRKSKQKGLRNSFSLGFYNFFARNNPSNVFFRRSAKGNIVAYQFSVVGAVVPNLSWNFIF